MQKSARAFALIALFLMPTFLPMELSAASLEDQLNNVNDQIQETNQKLSETQSQRKSLQGQVAVFNTKISSVQGEINSTANKITNLNNKITQTKNEILAAEKELAKDRSYLSEYLRTSYEEGQESTLEVIAKSNTFSEFVSRSEYLEIMQLKVKDTADKVVRLMEKLDGQQKQLEEDKKKAEELKAQQLAQRQELSVQRENKNYLLQLTKGNEAEYQKLVQNLRAQQDALEDEIWRSKNPGSYVSLGSVKAGDIIGYIGNSGYSSGPHLHFEIRNSAGYHRDPADYIGNGYFIHPVPGVWVSQPYGPSSWTSAYSFHTGIDYADGGRGTPIRATADGEIVQRSSGWGNTFYRNPPIVTYGNFVKIRHTNGMYSLYAHLR